MIPSPLLECPRDSGQSVTFSSLVKTIHLIWGIPVAAWPSLTFIILVASNIPFLAIFAWEQKDTGPTPVNDTRLIGLILGPTHRLIHPPRFPLFTFFPATRSLSHLFGPTLPRLLSYSIPPQTFPASLHPATYAVHMKWQAISPSGRFSLLMASCMANIEDRFSLYTALTAFTAYGPSMPLSMPARVNANLTAGFLTVLLPMAIMPVMVSLPFLHKY